MTSPVRHITIDSRDPYALATFWAQVVHGRLQEDDAPGDPAALVTSAGTPLLFVQVADEKTVKNRVHLDLQPRALRELEVERLIGLGAGVLQDQTNLDGTGWVVMADPEGNEFCVERSAAERGEPAPVDTGERPLPAIHTADERTMLSGMLDWYREGVVAKLAGMAPLDAVTTPLRSGTTAAGVVKHLALVEDSWFTHGLAQQPEPEPWASAPFDVDPDWEFHSAADDALGDVMALYEQSCTRSRTVAASRELDDTAVNERGREFSLRFVYLHMIEETARHLGHLDALRELADGTTGE